MLSKKRQSKEIHTHFKNLYKFLPLQDSSQAKYRHISGTPALPYQGPDQKVRQFLSLKPLHWKIFICARLNIFQLK